MNFIEEIFTDLDNLLQTFVLDIFNTLGPEIRILWVSMAILLIMFIGIKTIVRGNVTVSEIGAALFKIVIILTLVTEWTDFSRFIYKVFTDLPTEIGQLILSVDGETPSNIDEALYNYYDRAKSAGNKVLEGASWYEIGKFVVYGAILVATSAFCVLGAGYILLGKVMTAVMLAVAPVFILMLMFNQTNNIFEGWVKTLCNYALLPLFTYVILALILFLGSDAVMELETASSGKFTGLLDALFNYVVFSFLAFLALIQVTTIAANVGGGFALSSMNALHRLNVGRKAAQTGGKSIGRGAAKTTVAAGKGGLKAASLIKNTVGKARSFKK